MAENINALILPIGADVSQFEKSINDVKDAYKSLKQTIEKTPFNAVTEGQLQELKNLERTLGDLQARVNNVNFNNVSSGSKDARTALTSLSLVAQDLPFGFIAIQNNLPNLIQSFGTLTTTSKGVNGAIAALGQSLVGPAGLFLAFSVVTAGVTFAVQKYGSLSNAITALVSDNEDLAKTIAKVRKEYDNYKNSLDDVELSIKKSEASEAGRIATIEALTSTVTNLENSESKRSNALNELKSIDKDYYGSFTTSAEDTKKLQKATDDLTESIIRQAKIKALQGRITDITTALLNLEDAQIKVAPSFEESTKKVEEFNKAASTFGAATLQGVGQVINLKNITKQLEEGDVAIDEQTTNLSNTRKKLEEELDKIVNVGKTNDGKTKDILKLDTQELDAAFNLKDIKSRINEYGNILLNVNNTEKQRRDALNELIAINPSFQKTLTLSKNGLIGNKEAIEDYTRALNVLIQQREFDKRASEVNAEFLKADETQREKNAKAVEKNIKAEEDEFNALVKLSMAYDSVGNSTNKVVKNNRDYLQSLEDTQDVIAMLEKALNLQAVFDEALKNLVNFGDYQRQEVNRIARDLRFLQQPLEGLFETALEGGKENWKKFADDVIKQIRRITAALLAKSFITGLANILVPGSGFVVGKGLKGISDEGLGEWLDIFGSANFGGVQAGGLQMAGAVNLQLRGSDLVASINRTNSTISRVG